MGMTGSTAGEYEVVAGSLRTERTQMIGPEYQSKVHSAKNVPVSYGVYNTAQAEAIAKGV